PSSGNLGGVARKTRETIQLCEAAGFDVILVETVGVGQSEIAVSEMTDFFLILLIAGIGDELQGIKKGIIEMADLILINKADGENKAQAEITRKDYLNALHYIQPKYVEWKTDVFTISALRKEGIEKVWEKILEFKNTLGEKFYTNRKQQESKWLWESIKNEFLDELQILKEMNPKIREIEKSLSQISIREATKQILNIYKKECT
ncbi:MAG: methylmalonyl Co-A mutase-associated GTPase MeaB, partial [Leptospiraceae bacterium]|nr:methylmalonyl Co-A mutase-associated GTPase MeaB [Leptospiraceae bacterium]